MNENRKKNTIFDNKECLNYVRGRKKEMRKRTTKAG